MNLSIHINTAYVGISPDKLPSASIIDLSATNLIKPENRFELVLDGQAITDHKTGLMWWNDESENLPWEEGNDFCKSFSLGGFSDWFNGSDEQVLTIVDRKLHNPCLPKPFKTNGGVVWTSTETAWSIAEKRAGSSRSFWIVGVYSGYVYYDGAYLRARVRPVRRAVPAGQ